MQCDHMCSVWKSCALGLHAFSLEKVVHCDRMHSVWGRLCIVITCIQSGEGAL